MVALPEVRSPSSTPAADVGRYQLVVIAADPVDAVRRAGALMCDHAMAGWDVTLVLSATATDAATVRPARILGADQLPWEAGAALLDEPVLGRCVAVAAEVLRADPVVRDRVTAAMADPRVDLLVWERDGIAGQRGQSALVGDPAEVSMSASALAFKRHALAAAGVDGAPSPAEVFLTPRLADRRRPPLPPAAAPPAATSRGAQASPQRNCADRPPSPGYGR